MQLVINTFGASFHRKGDLFVIKVGDKKVELAAKKIQSVLITTGAHFSTDAILLATEHNIDVVLLDKYGQPFGRFWNGKMGSTAAIRREQLRMGENDTGLEIVKEWTIAKLHNQKLFLEELFRRRKGQQVLFEPGILLIDKMINKVKKVDDVLTKKQQNIMGYEGTAASAYWQILGKLPPTEFQFSKRSKYPAVDPVSAMINYAYGVLYSKVERACIIAGLDPFIGFLHTDNYNKKSLVFDMIEPFRYIADKIVLKLFTGRRCKNNMFSKLSSGAILLEKDAKELLLSSLNDYMDTKVQYKIKSSIKGKMRRIKRVDTILAEAHTLANRLIGKKNRELPEIKELKDLIDVEN